MVETDEWDIGELSALDFSQVFENDDSSLLPNSGGLLGRRAHHLVDMLAQPDDCIVRHILQIWDSDLERIKRLDQRQILVDVNAALLQGSVVVKGISLSSFEFLFSLRCDLFFYPVVFVLFSTSITYSYLDTSFDNETLCLLVFFVFCRFRNRPNSTDPKDVNSLEYLLSDVRRDANGSVVHVGATMMTWLLDNNPQVRLFAPVMPRRCDNLFTCSIVLFDYLQNESVTILWEKDFIDLTLHSNMTRPTDVRFFSLASSR